MTDFLNQHLGEWLFMPVSNFKKKIPLKYRGLVIKLVSYL